MTAERKSVRLPLVGVAEIAQRSGVTSSGVVRWWERNDDFPAPVAVLRCGRIFSWPEVERWLGKFDATERVVHMRTRRRR